MSQSASTSITPEQPHGSELLTESTVRRPVATSELDRSCALSVSSRSHLTKSPGDHYTSLSHTFISLFTTFLGLFWLVSKHLHETVLDDRCLYMIFSPNPHLLKSSNEGEIPYLPSPTRPTRPRIHPLIHPTDKQTNKHIKKQTSKANQMYYISDPIHLVWRSSRGRVTCQ